MAGQKVIKPKKRCCKSGPRCKRCPVVCKRLVEAGLAERDGGLVIIYASTKKKQVKAARKRRAVTA
jgi:hypothetical protein